MAYFINEKTFLNLFGSFLMYFTETPLILIFSNPSSKHKNTISNLFLKYNNNNNNLQYARIDAG